MRIRAECWCGLIALLLCWTVTGQALRAVDGDTIDVKLGIHLGTVPGEPTMVAERIRVLGVDTPERRAATMEGYTAAKAFTAEWVVRGPMTVRYCQRDSLGRLLGQVTRDGEDLAEVLIRAGLGVRR